jgi:hypothetical protein
MLLGLIMGVVYAIIVFPGGVGCSPRLSVTCGPFHNGMLFINGHHIHHWMLFLLILPVSLLAQTRNITSFAIVMIIHGLTYEDAFQTKQQ